MNIFDHYRQRYEAAKDEEFTLQDDHQYWHGFFNG